MPAFRLKCQKCGKEFHRFWKIEEFDRLQYKESGQGIGCFDCGAPRMAVIRSNQTVKDGFQPGFQRSIRKHCNTYAEYKAWLKRLGLIEVGYEDIPEREPGKTQYWTEDTLKMVYNQYGVKFSDREAEALKEMDKGKREEVEAAARKGKY